MAKDLRLRDVTEADLAIIFEHQCEPDANRMAAFPARDREAFMAHWKKIPAGGAIAAKTIVVGEQVVGNVVCWEQDGKQLLGYWIGKEHWGQGIATQAVALFLELVDVSPLYAHVAKHNVGSIRVLEKSGFEFAGQGVVGNMPDGTEFEELIFKRDD